MTGRVISKNETGSRFVTHIDVTNLFPAFSFAMKYKIKNVILIDVLWKRAECEYLSDFQLDHWENITLAML